MQSLEAQRRAAHELQCLIYIIISVARRLRHLSSDVLEGIIGSLTRLTWHHAFVQVRQAGQCPLLFAVGHVVSRHLPSVARVCGVGAQHPATATLLVERLPAICST